MSTVQQRIDKARWWALTNQPFYASLAENLGDVVGNAVQTSATDGVRIYWSEQYVSERTNEEIRYMLLHETLHNALGHLWRMPVDELSNQAGDYEIALILERIPGIKQPDGILIDQRFADTECERIRATLADEQSDQGDQGDSGSDGDQGSGNGSGQGSGNGQQQQSGSDQGQDSGSGQPGSGKPCSCGSHSQWSNAGQPGTDTPSPEQLQQDWQTRVVQAAQAAQAAGIGDIPADMQRELSRIRSTPVDWRREMSDFVHDTVTHRNDWSRAARRHAWQSVIYPRKRQDDFGTVIFVRDTSGSITDKLCAEYTALITDCVSELGCRGIVIDCDTSIKAEYEIEHEGCPLTAEGGGGTDLRPPFDRADELAGMGEQIAGIVYLTDLQVWADRIPASSEIPTLWLCTTSNVGPFGRTVPIDTSAY